MQPDKQRVNRLFTYDVPPEKTPSEVVIEAVSTVTGRDSIPGEADAGESLDPLYSVVDPDALDGIFQRGGGVGRVTFTYHGYDVTVHGDRQVTLEPTGPRTTAGD